MTRERGRQKFTEEMVPLGTVTVPRAVADAINALVGASGGVSKTTFIRQALLVGLHTLGAIPADLAQPPTTPYERKVR